MSLQDAFPELTPDQCRSFAAAERRLVNRLTLIACGSLVMIGLTLV